MRKATDNLELADDGHATEQCNEDWLVADLFISSFKIREENKPEEKQGQE